MTDAADDILGKADAFMKRRRPAATQEPNAPASDEALDDDIPLLTDIVPLEELASPPRLSSPNEFDPAEHEARIAEAVARQLDARLAEQAARMEADIRAQVQEQIRAQLQSQFAAEEQDHLDAGLAEQQSQTRNDLALALDQWLARELPDIVANEIDGLAQCLVVRISQALKIRLRDAGHLPGEFD